MVLACRDDGPVLVEQLHTQRAEIRDPCGGTGAGTGTGEARPVKGGSVTRGRHAGSVPRGRQGAMLACSGSGEWLLNDGKAREDEDLS